MSALSCGEMSAQRAEGGKGTVLDEKGPGLLARLFIRFV